MGFEKPKHVEIPLKPFIERLLDKKLEKDLCEGEEICPTCGGLSITLRDNPYFKQVDLLHLAQHKNEQLLLASCPDCYNGVVNRCKLCGGLIRRGWLKHDCEQQIALDRAESDRKEAEQFEKTPIAPPEVVKNCHVFYSKYFGQNEGFFEDWDIFFDEWLDEAKDKECPVRPEYVWITEPEEFSVDAHDICERATEDLYEGAYEDISEEDFKRLQSFLDDWCKSSGVGVSYRVSHRYKVRIPWEDYDKMYSDAE